MARYKAGYLRPVEALGPIERRALSAADDITTLAAGLLMSSGLPLLAIAIPSDGWDERKPLLLWNDRLTFDTAAVRNVLESAMFGPVREALYLAADALFDQLCTTRMCAFDARGLCAITDGTGLLLSADPPCPAMTLPDWLLNLFGPEGRAAVILPMARTGVAAILVNPGGRISLH